MKLSKCVSILVIYSYVLLGVVQSDLALSLEPTTLSSLESLSLDKTPGEVTAAQYVPLLYPSSDQSQIDPSVIQPSFTESFSGTENINQATLNRSIYPSRTKNAAQDPYQTTGEDYDLTKLLGSSKTAHQKTSAIEISSSSPISLTLQPHVSLSQDPVSSKTSAQGTEPLHSIEWTLYDTMLKTQDSHEIQSQLAAMTITSSVFSSTSTSVMNTTKTSKGNNSCIPRPCPLSTDICTPLKGGKFHCSCRQVYGRR